MGYMGVMCLRSAARRARGPESSNMLTSHAELLSPAAILIFVKVMHKEPFFFFVDCLPYHALYSLLHTDIHTLRPSELPPFHTHTTPQTDPGIRPALAPALPCLSASADVPLLKLMDSQSSVGP